MALAGAGTPTLAGSPPGLSATATIGFAIRIPPMLRMRVLHAGPSDTELEVVANLRTYDLRFDVADPDVVAVEVHGLGAPLVVGREGGLYRVARRGAGVGATTRFALSYRVLYSPGVRREPRRIPLRISAQVP